MYYRNCQNFNLLSTALFRIILTVYAELHTPKYKICNVLQTKKPFYQRDRQNLTKLYDDGLMSLRQLYEQSNNTLCLRTNLSVCLASFPKLDIINIFESKVVRNEDNDQRKRKKRDCSKRYHQYCTSSNKKKPTIKH